MIAAILKKITAIKNKMALAASAFIVLILLFAIFAPLIATHDPTTVDAKFILSPPSKYHILGTDALGRDIFSRIVYGTRISLSIGFIAVASP